MMNRLAKYLQVEGEKGLIVSLSRNAKRRGGRECRKVLADVVSMEEFNAKLSRRLPFVILAQANISQDIAEEIGREVLCEENGTRTRRHMVALIRLVVRDVLKEHEE